MAFPDFQLALAAALAVVLIVPPLGAWRLARRLGLPGWTAFLLVVPVVGVVAIYWIALTRRVRRLSGESA